MSSHLCLHDQMMYNIRGISILRKMNVAPIESLMQLSCGFFVCLFVCFLTFSIKMKMNERMNELTNTFK